MKDKELEEQIRDISFETISEMLDNPDSYGIYPTTKAFERIDREVLNLIAQERRKAKIEEVKMLQQFHIVNAYSETDEALRENRKVEDLFENRLAELKEDKEA